ncbi:MAG: CDP-alcohol phosphatidyltransferase family protein [Nitrospiraceae bacterium]|nr:CDP-alcohol phosphatidyltransferase family protein [Nitrospiraceae bacterium]
MLKQKLPLNVPNILTLVRIILIPCFATALSYRRFDYAFYIFLAGAVTDKLDGTIARLAGKSTDLGSVLDPLADKFMLITSFIVFLILRLIPVWLAIAVLSRDIIVILGWGLLSLAGGSVRIEPTRVGKLAIAAQFTLLTAVLFRINYGFITAAVIEALVWTAAGLTAVSGLQYVTRGLRIASERKIRG